MIRQRLMRGEAVYNVIVFVHNRTVKKNYTPVNLMLALCVNSLYIGYIGTREREHANRNGDIRIRRMR